MSKTISARLENDEVDLLNQIAEDERIDRSALIRKFLLQQIKEYEMKKVAEYYRKGLVSLQEAAFQAHVNLYMMMDYLQKEKITPPPQSTEEIEHDLSYSKKIFDQLK